MPENYIAYGVPLFIVALPIEALLGRKRGAYRLPTSLSDLGVGVMSVVTDSFLRLVGLGAYIYVFENFRLVTWEPGSVWPWLIGMIGVDVIYYAWHRLSHVVNVLWAVHVVHHQSEDFNYAVALRQPALEATSVLVFFLPLAMLGVDGVIYAAAWAVNLFYQFWVHTELVGKLGPLEWVLNTPSHHRVHHGINPKYLDRNYGGILIIWDRLFGSFQEEEETPVYGVTKPLRSYNPVWANVEYWVEMWRRGGEAKRFRDKLWVPFAHPAWRPGAPMDEPGEVSRETFEKYDPRAPVRLKPYVAFHFVAVFAVVGVFFFFELTLAPMQLVPLGALIIVGVASVNAFLERRPWAIVLDWVRQAGFLGVLGYYLSLRVDLTTVWLVLGVVATVFAALLVKFRPAAALRAASVG